jgi:hypothetical protein
MRDHQTHRRVKTNENQEIRAKSLEIAALIIGKTGRNPLDHATTVPPSEISVIVKGSCPADIIRLYVMIAEEAERYIRQD